MRLSALLLSWILLAISGCVAAMTDGATGIAFPLSSKSGLSIFGVGVRKKGPIKIYSVAMYGTELVKEKLASLSRSVDKGRQALDSLREQAHESSTSFLLIMAFKVGADKMSSAIADSVAPRHKGNPNEIQILKGLISNGVKSRGSDVASPGTTFEFECSPTGLAVAVNGRTQGSIPSSALAKAFCDVYLDDNAVSPALKQSCLENCCAP